uniref:Uncharacterized protein n=1 Tax=Ciona intestinalis TaxID=7719 RepID=H2XRK9_CIOIN
MCLFLEQLIGYRANALLRELKCIAIGKLFHLIKSLGVDHYNANVSNTKI